MSKILDKAYIMATPCSGKSTFIRAHGGNYKTLHLFDHDTFGKENDFRILKSLPTMSCVLGKVHKPDIKEGIYAVVLIEEENLRKQDKKRSKRDPKNKWNGRVFSHPHQGYRHLKQMAIKHRIPIFKTFEDALDFVIKEISSNRTISQTNKRVLITGISGQDGSYLADYVLGLGHQVFGMIRRHSVSENQQSRIDHLRGKITTFYGDMTDANSIEKILDEVKPDYIFNLAAQSHVRVSFDMPVYTSEVDAIGTLKLLEAYKRVCPDARFYQASSSEMFGTSINEDGYQRETTPLNPASPYAISKVFSYNMVRHYRRAYGLFICNGILFNHESPRRATNFVTQKVVLGAVRIKLGLQNDIVLGNLDSYRDWGHAIDYVKAMWLMINHDIADDFVIATGEAHSVRDMCEEVFSYLDLDYKDYVQQDDKYKRPEEVPFLRGDASKAKKILKWEPQYSFKDLMKEMVDYQLKRQGDGKE